MRRARRASLPLPTACALTLAESRAPAIRLAGAKVDDGVLPESVRLAVLNDGCLWVSVPRRVSTQSRVVMAVGMSLAIVLLSARVRS